MTRAYVTILDTDGREIHVARDQGRMVKGKFRLGSDDFDVVAQLADMPVEELTDEQKEEARLNTLTRAEFMAEVDTRIVQSEERLSANS